MLNVSSEYSFNKIYVKTYVKTRKKIRATDKNGKH